MDLMAQYGLRAATRPGAPGVYVQDRKLASLGLRVRRACSYHGLSVNVDLDLAPFHAINTCGHRNLEVTRLADLGIPAHCREIAAPLLLGLMTELDRHGQAR
jgi:lipoyl(octanoyl) transferase